MLRLVGGVLIALGCALAPASGFAATKEAGGSVSLNKDGASAKSSGGYAWPDRVIAGNALVVRTPLQFGFAGYLPRVRVAVQYERQLFKADWIHIGLSLVGDRGDWETFRMNRCGFDGGAVSGLCGKGSVLGVDINAGWTHKWYLKERPWLVPMLRVGAGYGFWKYPKLGGDRQQIREQTHAITLRPGGGIRLFPWDQFGLGVDVGLPVGFALHGETPLNGTRETVGSFVLGIEVLPLVAELRF